ncbi:MAG: excinuclease ABC subunit C [Ignavibacteria bacterium GWF2_33_9]|nr:MAG: excinuclease ABC subunit C [Ignavibacteria bacterium GWF2_33_9]
MPESIWIKLAELPSKPGVYLHKDKNGKIIYVGKAKNLKNRIRSYFQQGRIVDAKTKAMISHIYSFDYIIVDTEDEAFILEDNLIKQNKPKYNILLRDDKTFPYIKITNDEFPKIFSTRKKYKDGGKYFGPYTDVRSMNMMIRLIRTIFNIRTCNLKLTEESIAKKKFRVCLDYHIHKCEGPCVGYITKVYYNDNIKKAIQILNGKTKDLELILQKQMLTLSEEMKFEEAGIIKEKLLKLQEFTSRQKIVSNDLKDRDIFGLARVDDLVCTVIFMVREGKIIGRKHFIIKNHLNSENNEIIGITLEKWYLSSDFLPKEIYLTEEPIDLEYITDWLQKKFKQSVSIIIPQLGDKRKLVEMANSNAELILRDHIASLENRDKVVPQMVQALQRDLRMQKPPLRIECFDNSHIQGTDLVSSMVCFENGKPKKSDYRKFKNETVGKNDDFATMAEVVRRRYSRVLAEKTPMPDLIVIDGGKGQLSAAVEVLEELEILSKVTVIGLAKRLEEVYFPGQSDSILLPKASSGLRILQQIRDEAHRFAITFHRQLREKRTIQTQLTEIPGIGEKKATKLIKHFGSVKKIRESSPEAIADILNQKDAESIHTYFLGK